MRLAEQLRKVNKNGSLTFAFKDFVGFVGGTRVGDVGRSGGRAGRPTPAQQGDTQIEGDGL